MRTVCSFVAVFIREIVKCQCCIVMNLSGRIGRETIKKSWCLASYERRSVSLICLDVPAIFHSVSSLGSAQHESQIKFNYPASVRINSRVENVTGERPSHVIGDGLKIQPQVKEYSRR